MNLIDAIGWFVFALYLTGNGLTILRFREWNRASEAHFALPRATAEERERYDADWEAFRGFWHGPAGQRYVMGPALVAAGLALAYIFARFAALLS